MKKLAKAKIRNLRYVGVGFGLIAVLLTAWYFFAKPSQVSNEEEKQVVARPEDCLKDACTGRTGLTGDQIIFGSFFPAEPVSGTYVRATITENGRTFDSSGWDHYTDLEHAFKISFYDTGFDSSYVVHLYPSDSEKIDKTGCVTASEAGLEDPQHLLGARIYRDETSSPRSYTIKGTSWCHATFRRVDRLKTSGSYVEVFSTPVKDGTVVVYADIAGTNWLKCEDTDFNPAVYNDIQTQDACEAYNARAMAKAQEAHMHPERITSGGMTDAGWISGGSLKELLETFTRI